MYLHVGNKKNIRESGIIGIFDTDNTTVSGITRGFLSDAEKAGIVDNADEYEIPKSFVVYVPEKPRGKQPYLPPCGKRRQKAGKPAFRVCTSPLAPASLTGRVGMGTALPRDNMPGGNTNES